MRPEPLVGWWWGGLGVSTLLRVRLKRAHLKSWQVESPLWDQVHEDEVQALRGL